LNKIFLLFFFEKFYFISFYFVLYYCISKEEGRTTGNLIENVDGFMETKSPFVWINKRESERRRRTRTRTRKVSDVMFGLGV